MELLNPSYYMLYLTTRIETLFGIGDDNALYRASILDVRVIVIYGLLNVIDLCVDNSGIEIREL